MGQKNKSPSPNSILFALITSAIIQSISTSNYQTAHCRHALHCTEMTALITRLFMRWFRKITPTCLSKIKKISTTSKVTFFSPLHMITTPQTSISSKKKKTPQTSTLTKKKNSTNILHIHKKQEKRTTTIYCYTLHYPKINARFTNAPKLRERKL